jgi:glycosyltransferase involved in cell wall biosynthesis
MSPLVSVVIPAYNSQRYIAAAIVSATNQTWPNKEVIVVDDGSTDDTLKIARGFESVGVKVVSQTNSGAAAARNHAIHLSQGDYIQYLDADDQLAPDKIEKQLQRLDRNPETVLLSGAWAYFDHRTSQAEFEPTALWNDLSPVEWLVLKLEHNLFMQTATWLVSRKLTEAAGEWDVRLLGDDDGEYFCRIILASDSIRFVPDAKVFYRRTAGGRLSEVGLSRAKADAHFLSMRLHIQHLRAAEDSARVRSACLTYLQHNSFYFYPERDNIFREAQQLARELGGEIRLPKLSPKYAWIQPLLGWTAAKKAQCYYNHYKSLLLSGWDYALLRLKL